MVTIISRFIPLMVFFCANLSASEGQAWDIMKKVQDRDLGDNSSANMEMLLIDRHGKQRSRKLKVFSKDTDKIEYRLLFFLQPADVSGTGFLTFDYNDDKEDDQWLYLPALKKTKRIAVSDRSGSFMGSDFSYADMIERKLEDYRYKVLKETELAGKKVWLIESIPVSSKVVKESGYNKSILFVRQDNYVVIRSVNWVEKKKRLKYFDVKKLEKIDGIWVPTEMHMTSKKGKYTEHKTILLQSQVKFNQKLDADLFSKRRLEKGP